MAARGERKRKFNIAAYTEGLTPDEKAKLYKLLRQTKFRKKSDAAKEREIVRLVGIVTSNSGRREYEDVFAHNVTVTNKHEKRRRFKARWKLYTFFIVGGAVLLLAGYLLYSYVLGIDRVTVTGCERYYDGDIIEASGIRIGEKLLSPAIDEDDVSRAIINRFSYVKEVRVHRRIPDTIELELVSEEPVFVSELYDMYVLLSRDMRVLEFRRTEPDGDYIKLKLPRIREAVEGREIVPEDDVIDVIKTAAAAVLSESMRDRTTLLDVSDRFNVCIAYGGRFRLELGNVSDIEIKLTLAFEIMKSENFAGGNKGTIYLSDIGMPSAIVDNEVDLDW